MGGNPLIVWTIECSKVSPAICDILVSTEGFAIADVVHEAGRWVNYSMRRFSFPLVGEQGRVVSVDLSEKSLGS